MPEYATPNLRTIALVGHAGAGKTSLLEQLLVKSGMIGTLGTIERGTTVSDFDPLEKAAGHSLRASVCHVDYKETRVHLVDTPGHPDMLGQALGALDAV
jgi:elongation factor G